MEELLQKLTEKHKQHLKTAELFSLKSGGDRIARSYVQRAEGVKDAIDILKQLQNIEGNSKVYCERDGIYQKDGFCINEAIAIGTDGEYSDYVVSSQ